MRATVVTGFLFALMLSSAVQTRVSAQWSLSLELGSEHFWGGSVENTPERRSFHPYRPTTITAGLERRSGKAGFGLRLRYTEASMGLEGQDAVVAVEGVFSVVSAAPEASYRLTTLGHDTELLLHVGPLLEFWSLIDQESRTRVGAQSSVSLRMPLSESFALSLAGGLALIPSPFQDGELDPSYELRSLWRRGVAAGLRYRL
jgi:hypothetical protein